MKLTLMIFLLSACTTIKNLPTKEYDTFSFDEAQTLLKYPIHQKLLITYRTCTSKQIERKEAVEPLIKAFKQKFNAKLLGLSKATVKPKQIIDSSIFVPNEVCIVLQGHPITSEPLSATVLGEFAYDDKRQHIH